MAKKKKKRKRSNWNHSHYQSPEMMEAIRKSTGDVTRAERDTRRKDRRE